MVFVVPYKFQNFLPISVKNAIGILIAIDSIEDFG